MSVSSSADIHPSALIEEGARIADGVKVGPFSIVGPDVALGAGVELKSHAVVTGQTEIGDETVVFPGSVIGEIPQDLKFKGEKTQLIVGKRNRIREGVTMNTGTEGGGGVTRVGDDNLFMMGTHVGHDVHLGNRVVLANHVALAGHCIIEDDVIIGGLSGIHQFVRIGRGAIVGALTMVTHDVIPHGLVQGPRGTLDGLNLVGLKRRGLSREEIGELRSLFTRLAGEGPFLDTARALSKEENGDHVREILNFILSESDRSFLTP